MQSQHTVYDDAYDDDMMMHMTMYVLWMTELVLSIHTDTRVMHCAHGHSVATLLNPQGVNNSFPEVQSDSCKTCSCGSGSSFYRTLSR
jgi:hypothetical protein